MFGIKFRAWPMSRKMPLERESIGHTEDRVAVQERAWQDFVDTQPAATTIVAEHWQAEVRLVELA